MEYLESLQSTCPECSGGIQGVAELYVKNWWHEMTDAVIELAPQLPSAQRMQFFEQFVQPISKKLNQLKIAQLGMTCSQSLSSEKAREFLTTLGEAVKAEKVPENEEANLICQCEIANRFLQDKDLKAAKKVLEECKAYTSTQDSQDIASEVHAMYHEIWAGYYQAIKNYDQFYHTALMYLVYSDIALIPKQKQQKLAFDIGIAALLGEKIYNFGELLISPVTAALEESEHAWLGQLLRAFNKGEIDGFQEICTKSQAQLSQVDALKNKHEGLKKKMQLMSLLNLMFKIQNTKEANRVVPFAEVATVTKSSMDQVEFLLLHALAVGIIKGTIDQVAETITVTWVQARVLDREEVGAIAEKVKLWKDTVKEQLDLVQSCPGAHNESTLIS